MQIELRKIALRYDDKPPLLENLDFLLADGDFALIHGPSGCGKSSLLRILNRLQEPSAGDILIDGRPIGSSAVTHLRRKMGYVQQTPVVIAGSVQDNLLYPFRFKAQHRLRVPDQPVLRNWLDDFLLQNVELGDEAQQLSLGQKQRLALIRSLLIEPEVLLCDEPSSALDRESKIVVDQWLERVNAEFGVGVVLVTHLDFAPQRVLTKSYVLHEQHLELNAS